MGVDYFINVCIDVFFKVVVEMYDEWLFDVMLVCVCVYVVVGVDGLFVFGLCLLVFICVLMVVLLLLVNVMCVVEMLMFVEFVEYGVVCISYGLYLYL